MDIIINITVIVSSRVGEIISSNRVGAIIVRGGEIVIRDGGHSNKVGELIINNQAGVIIINSLVGEVSSHLDGTISNKDGITNNKVGTINSRDGEIKTRVRVGPVSKIRVGETSQIINQDGDLIMHIIEYFKDNQFKKLC